MAAALCLAQRDSTDRQYLPVLEPSAVAPIDTRRSNSVHNGYGYVDETEVYVWRPEVVVFDVNETLSDVTALGARFVEVGAPAALATTWFAQVLRDGFPLAATGSAASFREIGAALLRPLLIDEDLGRPVGDAIDLILDGVGRLPLHPDVVPGVRALAAVGHRLVVLTNGAASVPDQLFTAAKIRDEFEMLLSVEDAGVWKPVAGAYS